MKKGCKHEVNGDYLREIVFGANDGLVTSLALVAGLYAAVQSKSVIVLAGFIALVGGSVSMALGNYISIKSQMEFYEAQVKKEKWEIRYKPEQEREEVRKIYRKKGFSGRLLKDIVSTITSHKKQWLEVMVAEELGITKITFLNPLKGGLYIGLSFIVAGIIPLLPFFFVVGNVAMILSILVSTLFLFMVGALKTHVTKKKWFYSGLESLLIGAVASIAGYGVGLWLA